MSDLATVNELIARGDKEKAVAQLASMIIANRGDVDAWLLLGEIIDDPSRKKDCYRWALRLSPSHPLALTRLQELESPPAQPQVASTRETLPATQRSLPRARQPAGGGPRPSPYPIPMVNNSRDDPEVISYFALGIVAFLVILFVIVTGNFSEYSNYFCAGLFFLSLSAGIIILLVANKNRA